MLKPAKAEIVMAASRGESWSAAGGGASGAGGAVSCLPFATFCHLLLSHVEAWLLYLLYLPCCGVEQAGAYLFLSGSSAWYLLRARNINVISFCCRRSKKRKAGMAKNGYVYCVWHIVYVIVGVVLLTCSVGQFQALVHFCTFLSPS